MWEIVQAVLALVLVLGLLLLTLGGLKYLQMKVPSCAMLKRLRENERLKVLEQRRIDARSSLWLLGKDNKEFLVLISNGQALLLEASEKTGKAENHD